MDKVKKKKFIDGLKKAKEYRKKYYEENSDYYRKYQKEYYKNNPDKFKEYRRRHYEKNRDKYQKYFKERIICDICGGEHSRSGKTAHQRTNKHYVAMMKQGLI